MRRSICLLVASTVTVVGCLALFGIPLFSGGSTPSVASAATPAQQIGMKVLLITDSADPSTPSGIAYGDWQNTLKREGVPFDSLVTNAASLGSTPLPALSSTLSNGTQVANYEGVIVATSGTEGLSPAQWATLQTFEQQFSVRQLTAYAVPSSDYGLSAPSPAGGAAMSGALTLTADGGTVFPYLKALALDTGTWAYQATPLAGAKVDTLVSGPNSSSLLGIYTSADGRQTMYQTFNQNQYMLQSGLLRHGELAWLARNTYFGDQRNYLETHVDDNFLPDDTWNTTTHSTDFTPATGLREVPADVTTAASWSRANNNFRIDMLFNGGGSVAATSGGTDPLLTQFQTNDPVTSKPYTNDFGWINHTWDHPNLDEGCSTQNYIEAQINQNTAWGSAAAAAGNPSTGGLGLTSSTNATAALGNENPSVIVTGEHAGLANLLPGNPGQVDPPSLDTAIPAATGGTLAAGNYVYAVSDQFNTAAPGTTPTLGTGESAASVSAPVLVTGATGSVALSWSAVCHAGGYKIYRAPYTPATPPATGTIGAYSLIGTVAANTTADFTDPSSTTNTAGGGPVQIPFTDTGLTGGAATPPTAGSAVETPYEQNPTLDAAFAATLSPGIKYFGSDASKPYPNPADGTFATGAAPTSQYAAGATFQDAGATAIPRYPTNIYYNVSTDAQEVDEYNNLYDLPTCKPVPGVTTCNPAGTIVTMPQILASIDQGMFQHMMGNDPRPHYFHQSNLMSQTGAANATGTGLFYETINPLLAQYNQYFASNAPIEQPTMAQIGTLLSEQAGWATANASQVTGNIEGNVLTVNNSGAPVEMPLTGTNIGSAYAGSVSGWTSAPSGTSTYTALTAWPAPPTVPVVVVPPTGPAPAQGPGPLPGPPAKPITPPVVVTPPKKTPKTTPQASVCIQVPPANEHVQSGMKVSVYLKCQAALGSTIVTGKLALKVDGQTTTVAFRIRPRKTTAIRLTLPKRARTAAASKKHPTLHATLKISTNQVRGAARITQGKLTIQTAPPPIIYVAGQGRPTSVKVTHGKIVVTLVCKANRGRSARGKVCAGTLTLTISGQRMSHSFRMRSGKGLQLTLTLPRSVQTAAAHASHHRLSGTLTIVTRLSRSHTYTARGKLTVSN